ncbi:MAG: hypothetical protein WCI41_00665 [bacterium]
MDQNFQTSFIPKRPIAQETRVSSGSSINLFTILALFLFFATILGSAFLYFYKVSLVAKEADMQKQLNVAKGEFEEKDINRLKETDIRLGSATEILSKHIAISPIFSMIGSVTMKTVRYTKFSYNLNGSVVGVSMAGQAVGYRDVALQADIFSKNKNFIDPVFSNLSLDAKGNVLFDLNFSVDSSVVNYKQVLKTANSTN